jgi:pyruvate kinase
MGSRRHINLPGVRVKLPALTEKDIADLEVGMECKVDLVALSFVREAADVKTLRDFLTKHGHGHVQIVAKIEDQSAVKNINEIIDAADGVMVARGDLGVECPYEELPIIQRKIVKKCVQSIKPVIVATHMLESMISNPLPTRAEITDVANAVFEEADAIMLSGETTVGKYPARCVEVLDRVAKRIERSGSISFHDTIQVRGSKHSVVASAVHMANNLKADGICIFTRSGNMAYTCAGLRPRHTPIFAFTPDKALANQLCLRYGVTSIVLPFEDDPEVTIVAAEQILMNRHYLHAGAQVVFVSDIIIEAKKSISSVQLRVMG